MYLMRRRRNIDMLEGNLWKDIVSFTIPLALSGILQLLFNAIDMIVVGTVDAFASVVIVRQFRLLS